MSKVSGWTDERLKGWQEGVEEGKRATLAKLSEPQGPETCQHVPAHLSFFLVKGKGNAKSLCLACVIARVAATRAAEATMLACDKQTRDVGLDCYNRGDKPGWASCDDVGHGIRALDLAPIVERAVRGDDDTT